MITIDPLIYAIGTGLFTGGVAWGAVKVTLNGTKERVKNLEISDQDCRDRLVRIETKLDTVLQEKR